MNFWLVFGQYWLVTSINIGIYYGLALSVLLLLRPLTNRVLRPRHRVVLWGGVWLAGFIPQWLEIMGWIPFHFGLRELLTPRTMGGNFGHIPAYLPEVFREGLNHIALPGGIAIPFSAGEGAATLMGVLGLLYLAGVLAVAFWRDGTVKRTAAKAEAVDGDIYQGLGLPQDGKIQVKLCAALPTSFVIRHLNYHEVILQRELSPEQMELVFRHEQEHVRQHHPWIQSIATVAWSFYLWNPLVWAAYRIFRQDMELACDQAVLEGLDGKGRRAYAQTLLDLASDRPVWGGMTTFGECDAALRVRNAAEWNPKISSPADNTARYVLALGLTVFLMVGGPSNKLLRADVMTLMEQNNVWELIGREVDLAADTPLYAKGNSPYIELCLQTQDGRWCHALFRENPQGRLGLDLYVHIYEEEISGLRSMQRFR